ncbi:SAV_2336 N-terminal domain-related protein [uncultured Rubinisphaera sp.]|uniref:SAV_2336 N-terminal domain-related protein n=1 Tax=uncultured Rubinisphaera sp. TaxID=1678686 RepID=UPI0030DA78E9
MLDLLGQIHRNLRESGSDHEAIDFADAAWLCAILPRLVPAIDQDEEEPESPAEYDEQPAPEADSFEQHVKSQENSPPEAGHLVARGMGSSNQLPGSLEPLPHVPALPQSLQYERALRSLSHRVRSNTLFDLDEAATAESSAVMGYPNLVTIPAMERGIDAVLVIERSPTMRLWQEALAQLETLLWRVGAFRRLTIRYLNAYENQPVLYRDRLLQHAVNENRIEGSGRRQVVMHLTDCRSNPWMNGAISNVVNQWRSQHMTIVVQVLSSNMWLRTALRKAIFQAGRLRRPMGPLQIAANPSFAKNSHPVISFTPKSLRRLGNFLRAAPDSELACVQWQSPIITEETLPTSKFEPTHEKGDQAFQHFMRFATPETVKLARSFASIPLFLPVMRLTQHCLHPETGMSHLAEVFWSGLVYRLDYKKPLPTSVDPNHIEYDFLPGVRDKLLNQSSFSRVEDVFEVLSAYMRENLGQKNSLTAILHDPTAAEKWSVGEVTENRIPFARVASQVFQRIGGDHAVAGKMLNSNIRGKEKTEAKKEIRITIEDQIQFKEDITTSVVKAPSYPNAEIEVEDGTNIPKGTKFILQPQRRPVDLYIPSKAKETGGWIDRLLELKQEFETIAEKELPISCRMIQMRIPEFPGLEDIEPWIRDVEPYMGQYIGGLRKEFVQLGDKRSNSLFGLFSFSDVNGKPIQNSAGDPFAFRYGFSRSKFLFRSKSDSGRHSLLSSVLERGSNLLFELPSPIAKHIWRYWPEGFSRRESPDQYFWIDAVFELGWQASRRSSLFVERFAQNQKTNTRVNLKGNGHFPRLPKDCSPEIASQIAHENGFPVQIYSEIEDLASYSISFINELIYRAAMIELSSAKSRERNEDLEAAEHYILGSIELLESIDDKFETATTFKFLANIQRRQQRYEAAERSLRRVLDLELQLELHDLAAETQVEIAQVLESVGRVDEAIVMLIESAQVAAHRGQLQKYHERYLMVAVIQRERGRVEEALRNALKVVEFAMQEDLESLTFPATIECVNCMCELGKYKEAEALLQSLFNETQHSESDLQYAIAKLLHGKILNSLEVPKEAILALEPASELLETLGERATEADAVWALAKSYHMLGKSEQSESLAVQANKIFHKIGDNRAKLVKEWITENFRKSSPFKYDVFLSVSLHDKNTVVASLMESLKALRVRYWVDTEMIVPDQEYSEQIFQAIDDSKVLVILLSEQSRHSQWIKAEIDRFTERESSITSIILITLGMPENLEADFEILGNVNSVQWNDNPVEIASMIKRHVIDI